MARILVIEDDGALRNDISDRLADWGHEVHQAADGRKGFDAIELWQPDLVLSDINMPHESGLDLVKRVTEIELKYADMIFLFMSTLSASQEIASGIRCGADDYITKPIDYDIMRAKIDSHLRKQKNLLEKISYDNYALSMSGFMMNGALSASVFGVAGVAVLFVVYWIKTVIGINVFQDTHFSNLFW